jgi:hypothetical protein
MSKLQKKVGISLSSLLIIGLLLVSASSALAVEDGSFTLSGVLDTTMTPWKVGGTQIDHSLATCVPLVGSSALCTTTPLPNGKKVFVEGDVMSSVYQAEFISEIGTSSDAKLESINPTSDPAVWDWKVAGVTYKVSAKTELPPFYAVNDVVRVTYIIKEADNLALKVELVSSDPNSIYDYEDVLSEINGNTWKIGSYSFDLTGVSLPDFYGEGDTVHVTFKIVSGVYKVETVVVVNSGKNYDYTGEVTEIGDTWTVGKYSFLLDKDVTIYTNPVLHDIVKVTFKIVNMEYVAVDIALYAPFKNDNSRCADWQTEEFKIPPGIEDKLEGADLAQVYAMFCQGFGWGEIKNAFKLSSVNPEDLLARKAKGEGWGQIKKDFDLTPTHENNGKGHSNDVTNTTGKPETAGKPDKQNNPYKTENPGNSDHNNNDNNGKANGKNK